MNILVTGGCGFIGSNFINYILKKDLKNYKMELKIVNRIIAGIIILTNIYFIPLNYITIKEAGGPMGY